jgi:hypothetical protein
MKNHHFLLCGVRYNGSLTYAILSLVITLRKVQPQTPTFRNDTNSAADTSNNAKLSSLDKIIISASCGIFMGLVVLFLWSLCETRYYVARQHRLLLRNNTSGSFPQRSLYDLNDAESTTSNNDYMVGHYTVTSAVTTSSSSNENGKQDKQTHNDVSTEPVQFSQPNGTFGSPQASSSGFPFLYVDSPDFNKAAPNANMQETLDVDQFQDDCIDSFDTNSAFVNDSEILRNDAKHPIAGSDGGHDVDTMFNNSSTISQNDEELSIPSAATAFDVLSIGNVSLEQSMASSVMK